MKIRTKHGYTVELVNLLDPRFNKLYDKSQEEALQALKLNQLHDVQGEFALAGFTEDELGRHIFCGARTIGVPARVAVQLLSPPDTQSLVAHNARFFVAHTIQEIREIWERDLPSDTPYVHSFDPKFTRMLPAFERVVIKPWIMGDVAFEYSWFLEGPEHLRYPKDELFPPDIETIGKRLVQTLSEVIRDCISIIPGDEPITLSLSGGIDSSLVLTVLLYILQGLGRTNSVYARTLAIDGGGADLQQAEEIISILRQRFDSSTLHFESVHVSSSGINLEQLRGEAALLSEEYHIRDLECTMAAILLSRGIRTNSSTSVICKYEFNGDGMNELFGDYQLHDRGYGLITLSEVWSDPHLYLLGYPRTKRAHSLIFSGGLSRAYTRTFNPARREGVITFSPAIDRRNIDLGQRVPLEALASTPAALHTLRGQIVKAGLKSVFGVTIPVFAKQRFQNGSSRNPDLLSVSKQDSDKLKNTVLAV